MATYGEEVEILFDTHADLQPTYVTSVLPDDPLSSEMIHSDPKAEIHSGLNQDQKDDHANSKHTNVGLGLTFTRNNRYQSLQPTKSNREHCWWGEELLDQISSLSDEYINSNILKHEYSGQHDFVLLSEFSEMQGPLPLAVVIEDSCLDLEVINMKKDPASTNQNALPDDARSFLNKIGIEKFDLNSFVLRIVSVDRSSEQRRSFDDDAVVSPHQSPSIDLADSTTFDNASGETTPFRIPEDAQIYSYDSEGKFYSFTQYLTLFDISARGYVRPVSISYVTKDPHKILPRFSIFMERFAKVSQILKLGNFPNFIRDQHNRLQDLEYTESQVALQQANDDATEESGEKSANPPNNTSSHAADGSGKLSLDTLQQAITELKATVDQVEHHPVLFSSKSPDTTETEHTVENPTEKEAEAVESSHEDKKDQVHEPSVKQRPTLVASSVVAMTRTVSRGLSTVTDLLPFKGPWISAFVDSQRDDGQPTSPSKSRASGNETVPEIEQQVDSSSEAKYEPQIVHAIFPIAPADRKLRTLSQLCSPSQMPIVTQDDVRKTIFSTPLQMHAEEGKQLDSVEMQAQPSHSLQIALDKYAEAINEIMDIVRDLGRNSVSLDIQDEDLDVASPSSAILSIGRTMVMNFKNPAPRRIGTSALDEDEDKSSSTNAVKLELGGHRIRGERLYTVDDKSTISPTQNSGSSNENEEKTSSSIPALEDVQVPERIPSANYILSLMGGQIWDRNDDDPGTGLITVLQQHERYIKHVIFALMSGRTTLVVGGASSEKNVKAVVLALSLFVPGHSRRKHRVIKWYPETLTEDMLAGVKLIGVPKDKVNATIYALDVSVFDVDNVETDGQGGSLICGPLYVDGHWIDDMISHFYVFPSDAALIAHIHTIFFNIALKAYVLYHAYIHNDQVAEFIPEPSVETQPSQSSAEVAKDTQKWSMRKLVDYWRRLDERQTNYEREKGNPLDAVFPNDSPEKGHTWSDSNINSLDLKVLSNLMSSKESDLAADRPQFLSLTSMHESNLLRHQIAKAAAAAAPSPKDEASTSQEKTKSDVSNNEQNEATVTLESIAIAREQRPALADLDWSQSSVRQATPPRAMPSQHQPSQTSEIPIVPPHGAYGSLQSDFSGLSSATGVTSYYTSMMTASELQNEESFSVANDEDDDTGESGSSGSCSSDSSDDESRAALALTKAPDVQTNEDPAMAFSGPVADDESRRFMMEELSLSGDDQTIVVYIANII